MYNELLDKGYACLRRGDPEAARARFQHAINAEPQRPQGYFGMAQTYLEQGSEREASEEAYQALLKALEVDPTYVPARAYLAIEYFKRYDIDSAQQELERALHDEPTNLLVHIKYAEYYYRLGFYHRSVEMLEQGLKSPHGANEHVVATARQFLTRARQKSSNIIIRQPPDPRPILHFFTRFLPHRSKKKQSPGEIELS
jgi:Tfp pilus assembly protein PilF